MKKLKVLGILALMTFVLAGCQQESTSDREEVLEEQVAQLEQQVTSLEKEKEEVSAQAAELQKAEASDSSEQTSNDSLDSLAKAVSEAIQEADNAKASGSREENQTLFFEVKGKLQEVERRLDRFEDKVESQFRQGEIDYDKARNAEIELERLEDQLDNAEDHLENRFGYDD